MQPLHLRPVFLTLQLPTFKPPFWQLASMFLGGSITIVDPTTSELTIALSGLELAHSCSVLSLQPAIQLP
jgi:hypothetical protein